MERDRNAGESEAGAGGEGLPKKETQMWLWRAVSIVCVPLGPEMRGKGTADALGARVGRFGVSLFGEIRERRHKIRARRRKMGSGRPDRGRSERERRESVRERVR